MSGQYTAKPAVTTLFSGKAILWLAAFCLTLAAVIDQTRPDRITTALWSLIPGMLGLCALVFLLVFWWRSRVKQPICAGEKGLHTESWLLLLIGAGFLLRGDLLLCLLTELSEFLLSIQSALNGILITATVEQGIACRIATLQISNHIHGSTASGNAEQLGSHFTRGADATV